jgi:hypothetical protein
MTAPSWQAVRHRAMAILERGDMLALSINGQTDAADAAAFLGELRGQFAVPLLPVYCGPLDPAAGLGRIRVVFGPAAADGATLADLKNEIDRLADWIRLNDDKAGAADH